MSRVDPDLIDWLDEGSESRLREETGPCPVCNSLFSLAKLPEHVEQCLMNPPLQQSFIAPEPDYSHNPFKPPSQSPVIPPANPNPPAPLARPPDPDPIPVPSVSSDWRRARDEQLALEEAENFKKLLHLLQQEKEVIPEDTTTFCCLLCKEAANPASLHFLDNCTHPFCANCLNTTIMKKIEIGQPSEVKCPECALHLLPVEIKAFLSASQFEAFEKASVKEVLAGSGKFITCPNEECGEIIEALSSPSKPDFTEKDEDGKPMSKEAILHKAANRFRCRSCSTIFCAECKVTPYHLGHTCQSFATYQKAKHCRFCEVGLTKQNTAPSSPHPALREVCSGADCVAKREKCCSKTLQCGHFCNGLAGEKKCLPCLNEECAEAVGQSQNAEDYCNICWVEDLKSAPSIKLKCGHIFHHACALKKIQNKWPYSRIIFSFMECPLCKAWMKHSSLRKESKPLLELHEEIKKKGLERMQALNLMKCEDVVDPKSKWHNDPAGYALYRFSYFPCFKCKKPYFGGEKVCEANAQEEYNPEELVCGNCSDFAAVENCATHGKEYVEYKCRFCCNVAVWFCFGTTHFCEPCHKQAGTIVKVAKNKLPPCSCQFKHPPNGEEFLLGCSLCRITKFNAFN